MNPYTHAEQLAEKAIREARKRRVEFSIQEAYVQAFKELHGEYPEVPPEVHLCSGKKFFRDWNQAKRSSAREYHKRRDLQREVYRRTHPKFADIWPEVQNA